MARDEAEGDTLMALAPPADTDVVTMQALKPFAARLTAAHVRWTRAVVLAVNGVFSGLTIGVLTLTLG